MRNIKKKASHFKSFKLQGIWKDCTFTFSNQIYEMSKTKKGSTYVMFSKCDPVCELGNPDKKDKIKLSEAKVIPTHGKHIINFIFKTVNEDGRERRH